MGRPYGVLVADDDVQALRGLLDLLRNSGYRATGAANLEAAKRLLEAIPFDLLIADVRLRAGNGLSLVRQAREDHPAMAVIAITGFPDAAVEHEAIRLGATFMLKPLDLPRLMSIVAEKITGVSRQRRWPRKRVAGGFGATVGDTLAKVVDMSYGGFRLEIPAPPQDELPPSIELRLLPFGLSVSAELVWANRKSSEGWSCGAALSETDWDTARAWRVVVDALPKSR